MCIHRFQCCQQYSSMLKLLETCQNPARSKFTCSLRNFFYVLRRVSKIGDHLTKIGDHLTKFGDRFTKIGDHFLKKNTEIN
jgi:hypothetical protein